MLFNINICAERHTGSVKIILRSLVCRVAPVAWDVRLRALEYNLPRIVQRHAHTVAERHGLHHHVDRVVAVLAPPGNIER